MSGNLVRFSQHGRPGALAPDPAIEMQVSCFAPEWSVSAQASPLVADSGEGEIGPDRLFVRSDFTRAQPDIGAGSGFVPLDRPVVVAGGRAPISSTPLDFRLITTWQDAPGIYRGEVQLTVIVRP